MLASPSLTDPIDGDSGTAPGRPTLDVEGPSPNTLCGVTATVYRTSGMSAWICTDVAGDVTCTMPLEPAPSSQVTSNVNGVPAGGSDQETPSPWSSAPTCTPVGAAGSCPTVTQRTQLPVLPSGLWTTTSCRPSFEGVAATSATASRPVSPVTDSWVNVMSPAGSVSVAPVTNPLPATWTATPAAAVWRAVGVTPVGAGAVDANEATGEMAPVASTATGTTSRASRRVCPLMRSGPRS